MRSLLLAAAAAATLFAVPALAQDAAPAGAYPAAAPPADQSADSGPRAPDGSTRFFGLEPYFGVMGGWEYFDNNGPYRAGIPVLRNADGTTATHRHLQGGLAEGLIGANLPLGPVFVGIEGQVSKGFSGDIDWEYGGYGRFGVRAGDSGLIYGKVGYQWVNFSKLVPTNRDYNAVDYGIGFEVGPKQIGLGSHGGVRLRGEVSTFGNAHSWRPMAGIVTHF